MRKYYTSTFELYTHVSSSPGEAHHSFFLRLALLCHFCWLALSGLYWLARLSVFLVVIFSHIIIRTIVALGPGFYEPASTI